MYGNKQLINSENWSLKLYQKKKKDFKLLQTVNKYMKKSILQFLRVHCLFAYVMLVYCRCDLFV